MKKYYVEIILTIFTIVLGLTITFGMFILNDVNAEIKHNEMTIEKTSTKIEKKEDKEAHNRDIQRIENRLTRMDTKLDKILEKVK
jgi:DNA-binding transcriptional regulator GbsR (MarR family)